jgi:ribosomal protein L7Ae-like RNA K-turn-binding protein
MSRLVLGAQHRVTQLIGSAARQKLLVFGGDATEEAFRQGKVPLLLVAIDGKSALKKAFVQEAVASGLACSWGTKETLGKLLGRPEVAVVGVTDRGLAQRLFGAIAMALLAPEPVEVVRATSLENELSSEVE